ncbi:MAG TPA: hypothetical protein VFN13_02820 [Rudaea sp.]|nr:hypothetical protein [Rudaea sp.]
MTKKKSSRVTQAKPSKSQAAKPAAKNRPPTKSTAGSRRQQKRSAEKRKSLAAEHLWAALEEKKRRNAQPPAWQAIAHHDHPTPTAATAGTTGRTEDSTPFDSGMRQRDRSGD